MPKGKKKNRAASSTNANNTVPSNVTAKTSSTGAADTSTSKPEGTTNRKPNPFAPLASPANFSSTAEFKAKNARARELLMSTIKPGSEAWKVAEQYELASDIWTALEDAFGPNSANRSKSPEKNNKAEESIVDKQAQVVEATETEMGVSLSNSSSTSSRDMGRKSSERGKGVDSQTSELGRRKEAQARAARALRETMPNRDQRFLWAILHGGKPETDAWFNGTAEAT